MGWLTAVTGYAAPVFLMMSPLLSYGDQVVSMHRNCSSAGFSLDIPLIMLVASILRIFYYPGAHFDVALLIQSCIMVAVQVLLLKVALDHRPAPSSKGGEGALPFAGLEPGKHSSSGGGIFAKRPYNFWQWRSQKPYWHFLLCMFVTCVVLELVLSLFPAVYPAYSALIGYVGLSVEATLPLPQIRANAQARSCRGFRPSVLIPWSFKLCGLFQATCDAILALQYFVYGNGAGDLVSIQLKDRDRDDWPASAATTPVTDKVF
ncbi:pq loop repeat protein [Grosmannia clavigera kw1407]|uniref:Pq loop repeat protein n=1 Tax=Grosmannia clavigera (strain kw1407 / UAMH 11150) TaxID=655863 RepID=F0XLK5_GROCL|nr:pq loop repeat protein [Grosmannia clavigera kw1407]EFX01242.1 pq loop repeat protein [Grosmannia clavigera kw1407]